MLALCVSLTGCGGAKGDSSGGASDKGSAKGGSAAVLAADDGPVKHEEAEKGEELFKAKGCSACHAFGKRITGPDLAGVSKRRTREWIVRMAMHPDEMTKTDPTARELFGTYAVQMPNLKITKEEATALVEYFKSQDHPGEPGEEGE